MNPSDAPSPFKYSPNPSAMNLKELHTAEKAVSATRIAGSHTADVMSLQVLKDGLLKEHVSKVPALLICVVGELVYEDEHGTSVRLLPGDLHHIEPMVKHWVKGIQNCQLVLVR